MYTSLVKHPQDKVLVWLSLALLFSVRRYESLHHASRDNFVTESN